VKYFEKIGVGEFLLESQEINIGDQLIITGPTTGYVEAVAEEIRNHEGSPVIKAVGAKPLRYEWLKRYVHLTNSIKLYLLMFKLIHYRNRCIGCNACVEIAYHRWRMSKKDGKAVLLGAIEKRDLSSST
jgi:ferredoxin